MTHSRSRPVASKPASYAGPGCQWEEVVCSPRTRTMRLLVPGGWLYAYHYTSPESGLIVKLQYVPAPPEL